MSVVSVVLLVISIISFGFSAYVLGHTHGMLNEHQRHVRDFAENDDEERQKN